MSFKSKILSNAGYLIFLVFSLSIFLQCILFHLIQYGALSFPPVKASSLLVKASLALFIASFSLITKRKYWLVVISAIFSIWCMAELIYYRSNNIYIEKYSILMIGNMNGVWDSILIFNKAVDWLFLLPTIIVGVFVSLFEDKKRYFSSFAIIIFVALLLNCLGCKNIHRKLECSHIECTHRNVLNPFHKEGEKSFLGFNTEDYLRNVSVIHSFIFQVKELILLPFSKETYTLTEEERMLADKFVKNYNNLAVISSRPIIILIIESFENWTITPESTPHLYKFINENNNILYANKMTHQVRHGVSADGQMIINTGLLPITDGATCFRFPNNEFPAISKLYNEPCLIAALSLAYWNQKFMSDSYGVKKNYVVESWYDEDMLAKVSEIGSLHDFVMALTMTMHAPFNACKEKEFPYTEGIPNEIYRYLNSVKYTDKCLGKLLNELTNNQETRNYNIVITSDHNVLSQESRAAFNIYNIKNNLGFGEINGYIPFIIYSPQIENKIIIEEPVFQMDIYPTLLSLTGCGDYYWKGFGINLLENGSWKNRPIEPDEAQVLSDKMIRSNYFNGIKF